VGTHFNKNWRVSNAELLDSPSGLSVTTSMTASNAVSARAGDRLSGSFSQSSSSGAASKVGIVLASLRYNLSDSLMSKSTWSAMLTIARGNSVMGANGCSCARCADEVRQQENTNFTTFAGAFQSHSNPSASNPVLMQRQATDFDPCANSLRPLWRPSLML
jgi:hypothetical protein